jgi:hypothetical protein
VNPVPPPAMSPSDKPVDKVNRRFKDLLVYDQEYAPTSPANDRDIRVSPKRDRFAQNNDASAVNKADNIGSVIGQSNIPSIPVVPPISQADSRSRQRHEYQLQLQLQQQQPTSMPPPRSSTSQNEPQPQPQQQLQPQPQPQQRGAPDNNFSVPSAPSHKLFPVSRPAPPAVLPASSIVFEVDIVKLPGDIPIAQGAGVADGEGSISWAEENNDKLIRISTQRLQVLLRRELNRFRKLMQERHLHGSSSDTSQPDISNQPRSRPSTGVRSHRDNEGGSNTFTRLKGLPAEAPSSAPSSSSNELLAVKEKVDALESWLGHATKVNPTTGDKLVEPFIDISHKIAAK